MHPTQPDHHLPENELRALLDQATPGPWAGERDLPYRQMPRVHGGDGSLICECGNVGTGQDLWEANARLDAAAPYLASEVLKLRAEIHTLQEAVSKAEELAIGNKARALRAEAERDDARAAADDMTTTHRIISKIRQVPGIGYRPMLSDLPASVAALAAELARLRARLEDRDYGC